MKSYMIGLMTALMLVVAGNTEAAPKRIKGSGNIVTKEVKVGEFDGITASRAVDVIVVEGAEGTVKISADDNLIDWVKATVVKGALRLTIDDDIRTLGNIHVTITVPTDGKLAWLKASSAADITSKVRIVKKSVGISASSSGEIEADIVAEECKIEVSSAGEYAGEVKTNYCSVDASSSGEAELTLTTQRAELNASSAGEIKLQGAALECDADVSSAGNINASKFAVKRYDIDASSAGDAAVCCLDSFRGRASSGADITVYGGCEHFSRSTSSGGSIVKK